MNKILSLLILLQFGVVSAYAQCANNGDNIYRPELDKFIGTWKYTSGNTEAYLYLKKVHNHFNSAVTGNDYYEDVLMGVYKIIVNGQVIADHTTAFAPLPVRTTAYIMAYTECAEPVPDTDKVKGTLHDIEKSKFVTLRLQYISGTTPEIYVWQQNPERFALVKLNGTVVSEDLNNPNGTFDEDFTMPSLVSFVKQP